jgi:thioredoxin 2
MDAAASLFITCPHCLAKNRVPRARLAEDPVCGRCQQALLTGEPVALSDANFEQVTRGTELPVLVDFWAPWCGPCRMMGPQFDQAARELKGRALLVKVNSDENPRTSQRFQIRSIPTLVKLKDGVETGRQAGALPTAQIVRLAS